MTNAKKLVRNSLLVFTLLSVPIAFATGTEDDTPESPPAATGIEENRVFDDWGFLGLIGFLGLFGLVGLRGGSKDR